VSNLGRGVRGLRIGVVRHFFETDNPVSPATRNGIDDALAWFAAEGATVREVTLSQLGPRVRVVDGEHHGFAPIAAGDPFR
jgi:aspartyl-tRNA(Asn)/glutamyl-tRNA(Gln) amidotransferase subunit A